MFQSDRFTRNYNRYNGERSRVRQKISELYSRYKSDPSGWLRNIERLRDPRYEVYRIKITEGDRLIFCIEDKKIVLIDVGPHEVMEDFLSLIYEKAKSKELGSLSY